VGLFLFALTARSLTQHRIVAAASLLGGIFAVYLIVLQATEIHAFCPWCVAVDASAIVAAVTGVLIYAYAQQPGTPGLPPLKEGATGYRLAPPPPLSFASYEAEIAAFYRASLLIPWLAAGAAALFIPFLWGAYPVIPPPPAEIAALQVPGKVTILSFTDFECPFCRALHPTMEAVTHDRSRVALVRKMMPLSGHPGALPAALAYVCYPWSSSRSSRRPISTSTSTGSLRLPDDDPRALAARPSRASSFPHNIDEDRPARRR
jgi:hypothetical protein